MSVDEPTSPPVGAGGIDAVVRTLGATGSFVVAGHVGPDGDALGSMMALARAGTAAGKTTVATFGEPFVVSKQIRFLADERLVTVSAVPTPIDMLVVVDCGDRSRLGSAAVLADAAAVVVVIDHHRTNTGFGDVTWIDPDASSTAEMVHQVITRLGWPIDTVTATALYTGIVTDTGRFQYSATGPSTHRVAADLLEAGVQPDEVGQRVFEEAPFGYLGLAGQVLSRTSLDEELHLVWSTLRLEDLKKAGVSYEEADGLIDLIRIAEEAEVACLLRELGEHRTKGSLRSRGRIDVGSAAAKLGGGGHHNAAGFTLDAPVDAAIEMVRDALR